MDSIERFTEELRIHNRAEDAKDEIREKLIKEFGKFPWSKNEIGKRWPMNATIIFHHNVACWVSFLQLGRKKLIASSDSSMSFAWNNPIIMEINPWKFGQKQFTIHQFIKFKINANSKIHNSKINIFLFDPHESEAQMLEWNSTYMINHVLLLWFMDYHSF